MARNELVDTSIGQWDGTNWWRQALCVVLMAAKSVSSYKQLLQGQWIQALPVWLVEWRRLVDISNSCSVSGYKQYLYGQWDGTNQWIQTSRVVLLATSRASMAGVCQVRQWQQATPVLLIGYNCTSITCMAGVYEIRQRLQPYSCSANGYNYTSSTCIAGVLKVRQWLQETPAFLSGYVCTSITCVAGVYEVRQRLQPTCQWLQLYLQYLCSWCVRIKPVSGYK